MTLENWGRDDVVRGGAGGGDDDGSSDIRMVMVMANGIVYTFRYNEYIHMKRIT